MSALAIENLSGYLPPQIVMTNAVVFLNLLGALALGLIVGYERSYHGCAAGMSTYGLICMAAAALTGIGFLGAGVIMRNGLNISGLTTAASIWACSAIGIMIGVGFYASAIVLTLLSALCMMWVSKLESWLPSRPAIAVNLEFQKDFVPHEHTLRNVVSAHGYEVATGTLSIRSSNNRLEWHFVAVALSKNSGASMNELASGLSTLEGVEDFSLAHARN
jgi:putative Mg2+ transporter-C (MgtC) family protein